MVCKCAYFKMVNGELVCSACGKPSHSAAPVIEDKSIQPQENKAAVAASTKPAVKRRK
jgi:uncharacterized Zn finger protein (UPF0148 family)